MAAAEATSAYSRAEKAKRELDALLEQISNQKGVQPSVADQQRLGALSNQLASTVEEVRQQADGLSDVKNRVVWQRKAERLEADAELVREAVDKQLGQYFKAKRQQEDREKLFGRGHDEQKASSGPDDAMRDRAREDCSERSQF
mmetsp:Transcript_67082/g.216828  ORF Transcript_67082/g.216828 Transcript_67082/m.216828 type:complete len:144 (-) Transcript_67082:349-780(-)